MKEKETSKDEWKKPQIKELDVKETKGGFLDVGYEGPYNFLFGDGQSS